VQKSHSSSTISESRVAFQQGLLPTAAPRIDGFDVAGWNRPADETGGDYFGLAATAGRAASLSASAM
jgi:phosphoserine phosphatase